MSYSTAFTGKVAGVYQFFRRSLTRLSSDECLSQDDAISHLDRSTRLFPSHHQSLSIHHDYIDQEDELDYVGEEEEEEEVNIYDSTEEEEHLYSVRELSRLDL